MGKYELRIQFITRLSVRQSRIRRFPEMVAFRQINTGDAATSLGFPAFPRDLSLTLISNIDDNNF